MCNNTHKSGGHHAKWNKPVTEWQLLHDLMCMCVLSHFSRVQLFATLWTIACQASPSMGFSRQEYWSGLPWCPPGDLPDQGIEPVSLTSPALADWFFTSRSTWEAHDLTCVCVCVCAHAHMHAHCVWLFATPWTVAYQAPLSMKFSRQEYWSRLPFSTPGDLLRPRNLSDRKSVV